MRNELRAYLSKEPGVRRTKITFRNGRFGLEGLSYIELESISLIMYRRMLM